MSQMVEARAEARDIDPSELSKVRDVADQLPQGSPLAVLLQYMVSGLDRGIDVSVFQADSELSPNDAAELLHMSRPHLLKFLNRGDLAYHRVGSHRRIKMSDLTDFIDRRERAKATIADALGNDIAVDAMTAPAETCLTDNDLDDLNAL